MWVEEEGANGGSAITSYSAEICRGTACINRSFKPDSSQKLSNTQKQFSYVFRDLTLGYTYTFALKAVNKSGQSPWSAKATHTHTYVPDNPTKLEIIDKDYYKEQMTLKWTPGALNGGSPITKYTVFVSKNADMYDSA